MTVRPPGKHPLALAHAQGHRLDGSRRALAVGVLLAALALPSTASAEPVDPEAKAHLSRGLELFRADDFGGAISEFTAGYAIEDDPVFLYTMGQAELNRGHCPTAIKLFRRFVADDVPQAAKSAAREAMVLCAERMADAEDSVRGAEVGPLPDPIEPDPPPRLAADAGAEPGEAPTRKWYLDPLGGALAGVGVVGVGAGVGLLIGAAALDQRPQPALYSDAVARNDRVKTLQIAGAATAGVGGLLALGGAVRWALVGLKAKRAPTVGVLWSPGVAGVRLWGRW